MNGKLGKEIEDLFEPYCNLSYYKNHKSIKNIYGIDCVRTCINNLYVKYCHKELGFTKKYYEYMNAYRIFYRDIYWKHVNFTNEEIKNELKKYDKIVQEELNRSILSKMDISWNEFKKIIEDIISPLFDKYIPVDEYERINNITETEVRTQIWTEDNFIVGYICTTLRGSLKDYYKKYFNVSKVNYRKYDNCIVCGKLFILNKKSTNQKYCNDCAKEVFNQQCKENMREYRKRYKTKNANKP